MGKRHLGSCVACAALVLALAGCGSGWEEPEQHWGVGSPAAESQSGAAERGGSTKASGPSGLSKPGPNPVIRRLGPGDVCVGVFGLCDVGLSCVDGVCCNSACDGACERCDQELLPTELGEQPRYSGNCTLSEDCSDCVRYVNGQVPSSGDGTSWAEAFRTVQEGIDAAYAAVQADPELDSCDVWVAQGTYYIYVDDPLDTVVLEPGAAVYGGFDGTETERADRDWTSHVTTLSGYDEDGGENRVYHVVTGSDDAVLDGFTVTGGQADASEPHYSGGGMVNWDASPTVANCTFSGNSASIFGGGMFNGSNSSPTVQSCTFSGNSATYGDGGGMCNHESSPTVQSCTFSGNSAAYGGGMFNYYYSSPTVTNCTFSGNDASVDGGGMFNVDSSPTVTNCILWGDTGGEVVNDSSTPTVTYSNVAGGYAGAGNIDADPQFVGSLRLGSRSPCIDAANGLVAPAVDQDGNERVNDPTSPNTGVGPPWADMGAYESQQAWCVRYVDVDVPSSGDGLGWSTAFQRVREGIDAAYAAVQADPNLDSCQVWVAEGTYYIYEGAQTDTVELQPDVWVYGGFVGTETDVGERDWDSHVTTLSGYDSPGGSDRVYHVVTGSDDAVLDGFSVTGGQANAGSWPHDYGGGMFNDGGSPTVANCTFSDNSASIGGGMYNVDASPTVQSCTFSGNDASVDGGGMVNDESSPTVQSCTFNSNDAAQFGGGMFNHWNSSPTVSNGVLWGDTAPDGPEVYNSNSTATITYSNIAGGYAGTGNIDADPLFVGAPSDLHLGAGSPCIDAANGPEAPTVDMDGNERVDDPDSPNTGVGPPWADMGAYEYQP